jgi:hypothetical protein
MSSATDDRTDLNGASAAGKGEPSVSGRPWEDYTKKDLWDYFQAIALDRDGELDRLTAKNRELANENQALRARLLKYGEAPPELDRILEQPKETGAHPLLDENPLDGCEAFPEEAFGNLPRVLNETCAFWPERHKRDLFLSAALGHLSGAMPNVEGYWGADVPSPHGPNLYIVGIQGAAGGKGVVSHAKSLVRGVDQRIRKMSADERKEWEQARGAAAEAKKPFDDPEPPHQTLFVPVNISQSQLMHQLAGQGGRGNISSSEIDTLSDTLGQDWGKIDTFLRKAYHHETDAQARKGDGLVEVEHPAVSLILTGTPHQFVKLIPGAENGLYSRFCVYYAASHDPYQSQRPSKIGIQQLERFRSLSGRVQDMWSQLRGRSDPLRFQLTDSQWKRLDEAFQPLHREVQERGFSVLISIPRRAGLWAFRIAMTLAVLRAHDNGVKLRCADVIEVSDVDFEAALHFASTYADHSLRFARAELGDSVPAEPRDRRIAVMLTAVGDTFASGEAYAAAFAEEFDVTERTLRRDLRFAEKRGLIRRGSTKGSWEKTG